MLELYNNNLSKLVSGVYYGIDLGTTHTVISSIDVGDVVPGSKKLPVKLLTIPQHSPLEFDGSDESEMVASIIGVNDEGRMFVGNKLYLLKGHPGFVKDKNLFYHWKLDLGLSVKPLYKDAARDDLDDASKVAGKILNYCRLNHLGEDLTWENVVVTVPASFQANQRQDVLKAIEYASIKKDNQMLIDEPNAAFIGYLNDASDEEKRNLFSAAQGNVLVVDFGGGTCDLSVLRINRPYNMQLKISNLAISRYNDLGGQDIDSMIAELYLLPQFLKSSDYDFSSEELEEVILPQLCVIAEKLKIDLSRTIGARYTSYNNIPEESDLKSTINNQTIVLANREFRVAEFSLEFNQFYSVNSHLFTNNEYQLQVVDKIIQSVPSVIKDILNKSSLRFTDIDNILFVGGSIQNLIFVKETMMLFEESTALIPGRSDLLIAKGAAVYSFYKNALGIELLQPISSDTIGVVLHNTSFYPIIDAGVGLPVSVSLPHFTTQSDFQSEVSIPFCVNTEENIVGELVFNLPRILSKDDVIEIRADLSLDKVFSVEVYVGDVLLGKKTLMNPSVLANVSKEERKLQEMLMGLDEAKRTNNTGKERGIIHNLVYEYYNIGNYVRAGSLSEEWMRKYDKASVSMNNMAFCSYNNLGNRRKAKHYLDNGLKYSPNNRALNFNKGYIIEMEEGARAAFDYLVSLPDDVKNGNSIKFKIAILGMQLNMNEYAKRIVEEYQKGMYQSLTRFEYELLNIILKAMNIEIRANNVSSDSSNEKNDIKKKNLLRVNAHAVAVRNEN